MKILKDSLVVALAIGAGLGGIVVGAYLMDKPPVAVDLLPMYRLLAPNDVTELQLLYTDPDEGTETVTVEWSVVGQTDEFIRPYSEERSDIAVFMAPPVPGDFVVVATVTDQWGKTDSRAVTIYVR